MKEKIRLKDPQPIECENCGDKMGYQVSDQMKLHYTECFKPDGTHEMGFYSEYSKTLHRSVTAYCVNCGEKLKFKIIRD